MLVELNLMFKKEIFSYQKLFFVNEKTFETKPVEAFLRITLRCAGNESVVMKRAPNRIADNESLDRDATSLGNSFFISALTHTSSLVKLYIMLM